MENQFLFTQETFDKAFEQAIKMLKQYDGLEITSALKQAASDNGISEGKKMRAFVILAHEKMGLSKYL